MKKTLITLLLPLLCLLSFSVSAAAQDPYHGPLYNACSSTNGTQPTTSPGIVPGSPADSPGASGACLGNKGGADNPLGTEISNATLIIAYVAGSAAIILMLVGAIRYITSNGDSNGISSAKNTIIYAFVGLVIVVIAQAIVTYLVSKIH